MLYQYALVNLKAFASHTLFINSSYIYFAAYLPLLSLCDTELEAIIYTGLLSSKCRPRRCRKHLFFFFSENVITSAKLHSRRIQK